MENIIPVLIFIAGIVSGAGVFWLFHRAEITQVRKQLRLESESERVALNEKLIARNNQIQDLGAALKKANNETKDLRDQIQAESERRSAAEERSSRIPELKDSLNVKEAEISQLQEENTQLKTQLSELETRIADERKSIQEKLDLLNRAQASLADAFKALSAEALKSNNQSFLELAKATLEKFQVEAQGDLKQRQKAVENLVLPVRESLVKVDYQIQEIEKARKEAYGGLSEQVKSLITTQEKLQSETGNLVKALRAPSVRGRWGEIQLKRVIEIAGMLPHCDFVEQKTVTTDDGYIRPDLIVRLPGGKNVVVDAKAPLQAYLEAMEAKDDKSRIEHLKDHARQVHEHMKKLSSKAYWQQFEPTPEFVVMFLPGENFFSAALEQDPGLIEKGVKDCTILATPTTLIALLRAVAYGWRQEKIAESAQAISKIGYELYERLSVFADHFSGVGKGLDRAVETYNRAAGSLESRILPAARRFTELGATSKKEIPPVSPVERSSRTLQAPEFVHDQGPAEDEKR
ncbi:MAG: DNA recombination protein RmuC [Thermodesulfobacteriota bacterium]|nr:MAG: DNA recombination protein RmuC [Thermodesulfobacteriota bacterium]